MSNAPKSTNRPFEAEKIAINGVPLAREERRVLANEELTAENDELTAEVKKYRLRSRLVVPLLLATGFLASVGGAFVGSFANEKKAKAKHGLLLEEKQKLEKEYYDLIRTNRDNKNNCKATLEKQKKALDKANKEIGDQIDYQNKIVTRHTTVVKTHTDDLNDLADIAGVVVGNCRDIEENRSQISGMLRRCLKEETPADIGSCLLDEAKAYNRTVRSRNEQTNE